MVTTAAALIIQLLIIYGVKFLENYINYGQYAS